MSRKLISILLIIICLFLTVSCGGEYEPIPSTDEEARVVMTFSFENEKYEMKYELYRTFFLTYKNTVDGGDSSVWSGDERNEYIAKIDEMIVSAACDIFATLHIAKKIGKDPFSNSYDEKIKDLIKTSIEGGADSDGAIEGFGGDYDAYLESLSDYYMNYSVSTLFLRYSLAYTDVINYYKGNTYEENLDEGIQIGELKFDEEDVLEFYRGDASARVLLATLDTRSFSENRANEIRNKIESFTSEDAVIKYILSFTATTEEDAAKGMLIGRTSLDDAYYSAVTKAAFELAPHETSKVITVSTGSESKYYILYKTDKSEEYYNENKTDVYSAFIDNEIGKIINSAKLSLVSSCEKSNALEELDRAAISME